MSKFITLTQFVGGGRLDLNPIMISEMEIYNMAGKVGTFVTMMNGNEYQVEETLGAIYKLIDKSNNTTLTTWETGPR
jgi:uncharacterized protein YlzI (FlbEa/FlbD family)